MYDDDQDALAAEYVLGTLSAEQRNQAEALLAKDAGFAETVRRWEHRLGELNVMVEAVEPPPDLWERIKTGVGGAEGRNAEDAESIAVTGAQPEPAEPTLSSPSTSPEAGAKPNLQPVPDFLSDGDGFEDPRIADLAARLLPSQPASEFDDRLAESIAPAVTTAVQTPDRRVGRWRGLAIGASIIAVLLAAYLATAQFAPGLVPLGRAPQTTSALPAPAVVPQLVAVLQQEPTPPAFLIMLDLQQRTITIRRLTTAPDNGRSYELWLNSSKLPTPTSLGPVGGSEVTIRPIPPDIDVEMMRSATYSVSLERGSGSATGAPTGPMLFRGQMIEATPSSSG